MTRLLLSLLVLALACARRDAAEDDRGGAAARDTAPGAVIDSALSMDALLHRFQSSLDRPTELSNSASSREALTRRYLEALARSDTSAFRAMHITRAEYAYLYFPVSRMMTPPYDLPPEVAWLLHAGESDNGIATVLKRFGGARLSFEAIQCPAEPLRDGPNTVWRGCVVRHRDTTGSVREAPLFAAVIERDGRFKFFSYATKL